MHQVLIDAKNANVVTFRILVCLQQKFPQMFFIPRYINLKIFIQMD